MLPPEMKKQIRSPFLTLKVPSKAAAKPIAADGSTNNLLLKTM
jgi:hypothetical protein